MATTGMTVTNSSGSGNIRATLKEIYNKLKEEMLNDPAFDFNEYSRQWIDRVGLIAINDGILLRSHVSRILQRLFKGKPYCNYLTNLFTESECKAASGQLLDLIITHEGKKDLTKYDMTIYRRIVQHKTAYNSFYLPVTVACALLLAGENLDNFCKAKNILVEMGTYFQVQVGTDIEEYKCSWLVVQALEHADENQRSILFENYGKSNPACVSKVKDLYKKLNLQNLFHEYERESYGKLIADIETQPNEAIRNVLMSFLHKIYKRNK
nr:unnamed protein product [Digitaria exilis]